MLDFKKVSKEVLLFLFMCLLMFGLVVVVDTLRGHSFNWLSTLITSIVSVSFFRMIMLIDKKKENKGE